MCEDRQSGRCENKMHVWHLYVPRKGSNWREWSNYLSDLS